VNNCASELISSCSASPTLRSTGISSSCLSYLLSCSLSPNAFIIVTACFKRSRTVVTVHRFPAGANDFSRLQIFHKGCAAQQASIQWARCVNTVSENPILTAFHGTRLAANLNSVDLSAACDGTGLSNASCHIKLCLLIFLFACIENGSYLIVAIAYSLLVHIVRGTIETSYCGTRFLFPDVSRSYLVSSAIVSQLFQTYLFTHSMEQRSS
jgi:hypothetical protein